MEEVARIIPLSLDHFERIRIIWEIPQNPEGFEKRMMLWRRLLETGNRLIFVYEEDDRILGEAALILDNGDSEYTIADQRICLSEMTVHKKHRNKGIGTKLVNYACTYAKEKGYSEISLGVDLDNAAARHIYEKGGFTHIIREDEDEGGKYVKLLKYL